MAPESMHVTLRFLGDIDQSTLDCISSDFEAVVSRRAGFALRLTEFRAAPTLRHAVMIWAVGDDSDGKCASLASEADGVAVSCGLPHEPHPFVPHITLVRSRRKRAVSRQALDEVVRRSDLESWDSVSVLSATLFSSTLTAQGPVYQRLREFAFGADGGTDEQDSWRSEPR